MSDGSSRVVRKVGAASLVTTAYIATLFAIYFVHSRWLRVDVVLYSAILDAIVAAVVVGTVTFVLSSSVLSSFERILIVCIWLLVGYAFAVSVPTVLDRSLSFYLLEKLQQRGGGILEEAIDDVFIDEYIPEYRLVDVRLTEQLVSGTIVIENGCVRLTRRGQFLASFGRFYRQTFLAKNRLLVGEYTDDLVDPLKNSPTGAVGYECGRVHGQAKPGQ